jgi:hypothetical protein
MFKYKLPIDDPDGDGFANNQVIAEFGPWLWCSFALYFVLCLLQNGPPRGRDHTKHTRETAHILQLVLCLYCV